MFEVGLVSLLSGNTPLMATLALKPLPVLLLENAQYPCLTYQIVAGLQQYTYEGKQTQERLVQFDAWSDTSYLACKTALNALRNVLDAYRGTLTDGTKVLCCFRENVIDNWEFDGRCFRITAEYRFSLVEAA